MEEQKIKFKLFDLYDMSEVKIQDEGLKDIVSLEPRLILKDSGKRRGRFEKAEINIVERLMRRIGVCGHRGKKHKLEKGIITGAYKKNMKIVMDALKIVGEKTKQNPVQVLIKAIENSAPRDEITVIEYGGARYPQAVDVSPLRRVNLAIRWITQGASDKAFNKKKTIVQALSEEIILASENNNDSFGVRKRNESEKQADSAR